MASWREVGGAHGLGHADAGLAGGAGVAVGHVGRGLLAVSDDPLDADQVHLGQRPPQNRRHQEDVGNAVGLESIGHEFRASHTRHFVFSQMLFNAEDAEFLGIAQRLSQGNTHAISFLS